MADITLVAESGRRTGSSESRRLRSAGRVPAVVYGHGMEGISVSVDGRDLRHALSGGAGLNQLLELRIGSHRHLAMARVLQRHPVRNTVVHVDFQIVRRDEVVTADVPILLIGEAKAVAAAGGMLEHQLVSLAVQATPDKIPASIEIDVSGLGPGDAIRVGDLTLPSGVGTELPAEEPIVVTSVSRAAQQSEAAGEDGAATDAAAPDGATADAESAGTAEAGGSSASED